MLLKTEGIVIKYFKYKESSIIAKVYTRELGIQSFIINEIRSKSSSNRIALLQPLSLLDLVIYNKENSSIKRISEIKLSYPYKTSNSVIKKSAVILFLSEALDRLLIEATPNEDIFDFLKQVLIDFDLALENYDNFHLHFLLTFTHHFGIQPLNAREMLENSFNTKGYFEKAELTIIDAMISNPFESNFTISNVSRKKILDAIINFYKSHIDGFGEIRSLKVLTEVFS